MAELADAQASGACVLRDVRVQIPLRAHNPSINLEKECRKTPKSMKRTLHTFLIMALLCTCLFSAVNTAYAQTEENTITDFNEKKSKGPDFNGDGFDDLAVGATGERFSGGIANGAVTLLFGGAGQKFTDSVILHQGLINIEGSNEPYDRFGSRTTHGDFNGDGLDDLLISAPQKDIDGKKNTGMVWVLEGAKEGMGVVTLAKAFDLTDFIDVSLINESDNWGEMLTTGDFNGDEFEDAAISAPNSDWRGRNNAGLVVVLYGSEDGFVTSNSSILTQTTPGMPGASQEGDRWGASLTSGDFNKDGFFDLVIGAPGENYGSQTSVGALTVIYGGEEGLTTRNTQRFHQNSPKVPDRNEENDQWGSVLTSGDFNQDAIDDLIVGTPNESSGSTPMSGSVTILYGSENGITSQKSKRLHQGSFGMQDSIEAFDRWGSVLTIGDFNGDLKDDLAIGTPAEGIGNLLRSGAITILYGSNIGLTGLGSSTIHQNNPGLNLNAQNADHWGDSLGALDINGDGKSELVVGASSKSIGTQFDSGIISLFWGTDQGIIPEFSRYLDQNITGIPDDNKSTDYWGRLGTSAELTLQRPATGLITPSGVNVVILAELPNYSSVLKAYIVRTPCGRAVRVYGGTPVNDIQIVIDPGHGGIDGGAGYYGLREHSVNLSVAEAFQEELTIRGINSFLVRTSNYHIPLSSRGLIADHVQAKAMISIHHNAPKIASSRHPGTEAFIQSNSANSARLGTLVYESVYEALDQFSWIQWTSQYDAGVIRVLNKRGTDTYGMLSRPKTPTTLVELTYLANRAEANLIKSADYLPTVTQALADATEQYLNEPSGEEYQSTVRNFTAADAPGYSVCRDPELGAPFFFDFDPEVFAEAIISKE